MDLKIAATTPMPQAQGKASSGHDQRKKRVSQDGIVGLVNIGNSCYMNAALQALSNCPPFRQYFLECHTSQPATRLSDAMATLFQNMWTSDRPCGNLSPRQISSSMKNPMFRGTQQQDTQEFLRSLLTQLHEETSYLAPPMESSRNSMTSLTSQDSNGSDDSAGASALIGGAFHVQAASTQRPSNNKACSKLVEKQTLEFSNIYVLDLELKKVVSVHKKEVHRGAGCKHSVANDLSLDAPSKDSSCTATSLDNAPPKDTPSDDAPPKGTPSDDAPPKDTPSDDAPPKDTPSDGAPPKDTPSDDAPPKDTPSDDASPKDTPTDDAPPKDMPSDDAPPKGTPSDDALSKVNTEPVHPIDNTTSIDNGIEPTTLTLVPPTVSTTMQITTPTGQVSQSTIHEVLSVSETTGNMNNAASNGPSSVPDCGSGPNSIPESRGGSTPEVKSKLSHTQDGRSLDTSVVARSQHRVHRVVRSIVTEMFEGTLVSKVKCFNCKKASVTQEIFQDLALPIPGRKEMSKFAEKGEQQKEQGVRTNGIGKKVYNAISFVIDLTKDSLVDPHTSLDDCLNAYFDSYELKGDNRYFCSNCNSFQTSVKKMRITRLPEILCIHLKRFRFDTYLSKKIGRHIHFPLLGLNLSPYLHKGCGGASSYELTAVITHDGGVSGGHYVAFAKNTLRNQWYEYNDTHVTPVSTGTVAGAEGYVLFYRKTSESRPGCQSVDIGSVVPSQSTTISSFYISRHWLLLLKHHSNPGPIFCEHVCQHGGILPSRRIEEVSTKVVSVAKETWEELMQRYGGGPALRSLEVCAVCQDHLKSLNERREKEKNDIYQIQTKAYTTGTPRREPYLLANSWLQQWQNFIHCKTLDVQPPGAIDNSQLLEDKNGTFVYNGHLYRKLSHEVWSYFVQLYEGGPTLMTCPPRSLQ